mgnify:CR=1 FL=1
MSIPPAVDTRIADGAPICHHVYDVVAWPPHTGRPFTWGNCDMTFSTVERCLALLIAVLLTLSPTGPTRADEAGGDNDFMEAPRQLSGTLSGKQFIAGSEVFLDATVDDDVFAAGGDVELRDAEIVDLFAAGAFVTLENVGTEDAILAGGKVDARGRIAGDLIAAGFSVELGPGSQVGGDVLAAGARITLAGEIDGQVRAAAGDLRLDGKVAGDARLVGERIVLGPNAQIAGDLIYRSEQKLQRMDGAQVAGQIERRGYGRPEMPGIAEMLLAGALGWVGAVLSGVALAALLVGAVPRLVAGASDSITMQPWPSLGIGVLLLVGVPVAVPILMATVIGIPIAVLAMLLYLALIGMGLISMALWIGQHLPKIGGRHAGHIGFGLRFGRTAAGIFILGLVALLPFLGGALLLVAAAFGLGSTAVQGWYLVGGRT